MRRIPPPPPSVIIQSSGGTAAPPHPQDFGPVERATKYEYNAQRKEWDRKEIRVRVSPTPFAHGGMRYVVAVREVDTDGGEVAMIGKFFLPECHARTEDYFLEASMQCTAETFAQEYNKNRKVTNKIAFLSCYVVQLHQRQRGDTNTLFIMEPMLRGEFKKHNNNYGEVYNTHQETPEAFSHYTYEKTGGQMLVCDIQGVGEFFTDPQIHTPLGTDYGMGNMGAEGILRWQKAHRCNHLCQILGLQPLREPRAPHGPPRQMSNPMMESYYRGVRGSLTNEPEAPLSPEDLALREAIRQSLLMQSQQQPYARRQPPHHGMTEEAQMALALKRSLQEK